MTEGEILRQVVRIILTHAKPRRVYFYGSRAAGEEREGSDLDVAYDDPDCKEEEAVAAEVQRLPTLLKIDVRNLARTEPRFRNRVESTGRVLYSATKRLRFEDALANFRTACDRFVQALAERPVFYQVGFGDAYTDVIAKRFEFAFEMAWRTLARYFDHVGIGCADPRACFKEARSQGIVSDEAVWLEMIEHRELLADTYDLIQNHEIMARAERFRDALLKLLGAMEARAR
jgi:nucleotidyltransferase substrate binding protein (TIGR01987 family)